MGRHQENITRLVYGAITCAVSFCLLTCAFVNVAYADYNDLPNSYTDETGGNYNPQGLIFGLPDSLFTDYWYADESIFQQSLSSAYQIVQDKTTIYTLIVADCVRQSNNWLSQIKSYVEDTSSAVSTISNDTGNLLLELRFNSYGVNGNTTKTIRGLVKDIADAMVTNNASLQQIKEQFEDEHGTNYLSSIFYNTRNIDNIYQQLANGTSGTISGTVNSISQKLATVSSNVQLIKDSLSSGGYIGQQLSTLNTNISSLLTAVRRVQGSYTNSSGTEIWYTRDMPISILDLNRTTQWTTDVRDALQGILSSFGSNGTIGQQLADLNSKLTTISNNLQQYTYNDANGGSVRYYWVAELMPSDSGAQEWMTNVRNYLDNIRNYSANISSKIDLIRTDVSSIVNALGSGGYIGQQLSTLNTNISNLLTAVRRVQARFINASGTELWYLRDMPISSLDLNRTTQWTTDIRNYLETIANKPNIDMTSTVNKLNDILLAIQGLDLVFNVPTNWPDIIGDFDDLDFGEKVDDLIDELENLAPFGAIFLISNQINLLTQVDPLTDPSFVMDFNFAGTSENLTLDVSWLNDAKPLFNFITIFLLMYSLLIISMKYVRQEATS